MILPIFLSDLSINIKESHRTCSMYPRLENHELIGSVRKNRAHKVFYNGKKFILHNNRNIYPIEWIKSGSLVRHQKFIVQRRVIESHPEYWRDKHFGLVDVNLTSG